MKQMPFAKGQVVGCEGALRMWEHGKVWQNNLGMNHSPVAQHAAVLRKQWEEERNPLIQPCLAPYHVPYCRTHYPGFCGPCWQLLIMTQPLQSSRLLWNSISQEFFPWVPLISSLDQNVCHKSPPLTAQHLLYCLGRGTHTPNEWSDTKPVTSLCINLITKS